MYKTALVNSHLFAIKNGARRNSEENNQRRMSRSPKATETLAWANMLDHARCGRVFEELPARSKNIPQIREKLSALPLYITCKKNIQYITGFTGSYGSILLTQKKLYFFTDARYFEETKKSVRLAEIFSKGVKVQFVQFQKNGKHPLADILKKDRIKKLQFEKHHISYAQYLALKKLVKGTKLIPSHGCIEDLRAIKTLQEIQYIQKAQNITEKIFANLKHSIKIGQTELEIDEKIHTLGKQFGGQGMAFEPIVAFGENAAIPHHQNGNRKLKKGDIVLIDMGAKYKGYHADMTRTLFTAKPTPLQKKIYQLVLDTHKLAVSKIKPEIKASHLEKTVRTYLKKHDYEANFTHALGHGVGLEIHESPSLSEKIDAKSNPQKLKKNMLITIEPGLYFAGKFGIRLENIYQVTSQGAKNLNTSSLELEKNTIKAEKRTYY